MELIHPKVQEYAETFSSGEDSLLKEIADYTYRQHDDPQMLSGHLQGKVLEMISCMIRPKRILEIGTFTGYSALCLAKGLTDEGLLHTIDIREADVQLARSFFNRSAYADKIISHCGNALDIVPKLDETWDLVFIDAGKPEYIGYFNLVLPQVRKNGFILADNIFFHGEVLPKGALQGSPHGPSEEENVKGKNAKGIAAFNEFIKERTDIEKVILTIRDGLYLIRKL